MSKTLTSVILLFFLLSFKSFGQSEFVRKCYLPHEHIQEELAGVDLSHLPAGLYFISYEKGGRIFSTVKVSILQ